MSPKPAIILHNALLKEFYMACDWCHEIWGVRIWHPLISERQILKQTLKWAISPPPSLLSLPAEMWNIKGTESPSAFKRKVKRSTFLVRFWKWSHLKAICLRWNLSLSPLQRAVTSRCQRWWRQTSIIRHVYEHSTWCLAGLAEQYVSLKICRKTRSGTATSAFCSLIPVVLKEKRKIWFWDDEEITVHQSHSELHHTDLIKLRST